MRHNIKAPDEHGPNGVNTTGGGHSPWLWIILVGCLAVVLLGLLLPRRGNRATRPMSESKPPEATGTSAARIEQRRQSNRYTGSETGLTADQIVANKVSQFAKKRRGTAHAMAARLGIKVLPEIERFFDLAEAGRWDELKTLFASLRESRDHGTNPEALRALWSPVMETYGVTQITHEWPADKLLDYGQTILDSLRPGMVYVGGTDPGRFIPTLLNETGDAEPRIILTQNALADSTYLDYVHFLYGDQMTALSPEDLQRGFQDYMADAQKRFDHDRQFPDEPKQLRPGEDIQIIDNRVQVSGQVAVMEINELLFRQIMDKNPNLSFAMEESYPLKSTYPNAAPIGPIMELGVPNEQQALTPESATQSVNYWRSAADQLLADTGDAATEVNVLKTYSKMASAQAALFADHNLPAQAEQAFQIAMQIYPSNPEAINPYVALLVSENRITDAIQVAQKAVNAAPANQQFLALLQQLKQRGN